MAQRSQQFKGHFPILLSDWSAFLLPTISDSEEVLALASSILDDIETNGAPLDTLIFKGSRLARIAGDETLNEWITFELVGYGEMEECRSWLELTKRHSMDPPFVGGGVHLAAMISSASSELQLLRVPDVSGEYALAVVLQAKQAIREVSTDLAMLRAIESSIRALLHKFAAKHYYRIRLSSRQYSMFERAHANIDALLAGLTADTLRRIDSAFDRLRAGDSEAISHALSSCRRLIDLAASELFPPTDDSRCVNGQEVSLGERNVLNRIKAFVDDHTNSSSRRKRLKQEFTNLYDRTSAGVHSEVTAAEAEFIFLSVYSAVGELVQLRDRPETPVDVAITEPEPDA